MRCHNGLIELKTSPTIGNGENWFIGDPRLRASMGIEGVPDGVGSIAGMEKLHPDLVCDEDSIDAVKRGLSFWFLAIQI